VPCRTADAAATVDGLMRWIAVFDVVLLWISDRGSHFKNEVVQRVQKELKAKHHFTTANCYVLVAEHRKSVFFKLQVKWKGPRRECRVRLRVRRIESTHERAQSRVHNTLEIQ
jgi:hypothetical protein